GEAAEKSARLDCQRQNEQQFTAFVAAENDSRPRAAPGPDMLLQFGEPGEALENRAVRLLLEPLPGRFDGAEIFVKTERDVAGGATDRGPKRDRQGRACRHWEIVHYGGCFFCPHTGCGARDGLDPMLFGVLRMR